MNKNTHVPKITKLKTIIYIIGFITFSRTRSFLGFGEHQSLLEETTITIIFLGLIFLVNKVISTTFFIKKALNNIKYPLFSWLLFPLVVLSTWGIFQYLIGYYFHFTNIFISFTNLTANFPINEISHYIIWSLSYPYLQFQIYNLAPRFNFLIHLAFYLLYILHLIFSSFLYINNKDYTGSFIDKSQADQLLLLNLICFVSTFIANLLIYRHSKQSKRKSLIKKKLPQVLTN